MTKFVCPARKEVRALFGMYRADNIINSSYFKITDAGLKTSDGFDF